MSPSSRLLVYGATGYTGKLVAAEAAERGIDIVLGGRDAEKLKAVAKPLGFETRSVALHDGPRLRSALEDVAFGVSVEPGRLVCLSNGRALHGRSSFEPVIDDQGRAQRWVQRVFVTERLDAFSQFDAVSDRVFEMTLS